ncbi:oligopeptide transporter, OPT family protein [Nitrospira sp.]|nr:oligopeptide transporter, OPT family protein [Nitrospira sp.]
MRDCWFEDREHDQQMNTGSSPAQSTVQGLPPPIVPSHVHVRELTVRSVLLGILLSALLAGANAYLGLFAGMTVSASIPAAVVSMAILRWFRQANILENNLVQTAASSGEALAAGVIFTVPALLILGSWDHFDYWRTVTVSLIGGVLGVLFTIPLRRALVQDPSLRFPEGVATAEVLKAGMGPDSGTRNLSALVGGALFGGAMKMGESGFRFWTESLEGAAHLGRTVVYGGVNLSPALMAVGFIIQFRTAAVMFAGGVLGWLILLPLEGWYAPVASDQDAISLARSIWSDRIRYVGIGAMLVGGLWTLLQVREALVSSLLRLFRPRTHPSGHIGNSFASSVRTDRDTPGVVLLVIFGGCVFATLLVYQTVVMQEGTVWLMTILMVVAAFLFSSVAGYMAGLVGSSSNPVSGVTIATIMLTAGLLLMAMGAGNPAGPAAALLIAAVVCCAAAMGGDNLQDLKTGQIVGATPWKQQIMQLVGVGAGAVMLPPILSLLHAKYGIGLPTPGHPHPLSAPQATLMANLSKGIFMGDLPWDLVGLGGVLAGGIIAVERRLSRSGRDVRIPILAVALGIYLPLKLSAAVMLGGLVQHLAARRGSTVQSAHGNGLLMAAGLITGEALMGIFLAIPIALTPIWPSLGTDPFRVFEASPLGPWPGVLLMAVLVGWIYRSSREYA